MTLTDLSAPPFLISLHIDPPRDHRLPLPQAAFHGTTLAVAGNDAVASGSAIIGLHRKTSSGYASAYYAFVADNAGKAPDEARPNAFASRIVDCHGWRAEDHAHWAVGSVDFSNAKRHVDLISLIRPAYDYDHCNSARFACDTLRRASIELTGCGSQTLALTDLSAAIAQRPPHAQTLLGAPVILIGNPSP